MAIHPVNDRLKIKIDPPSPYGDQKPGHENGVVVEVPDVLLYLSFHSFAFEDSFVDNQRLEKVQEYYSQFKGKRVFWEALQDRGRKISDETGEYIYLQMTDVLAYADDVNDKATVVEQTGSAGSFNL